MPRAYVHRVLTVRLLPIAYWRNFHPLPLVAFEHVSIQASWTPRYAAYHRRWRRGSSGLMRWDLVLRL
jgi:hypothetical protein